MRYINSIFTATPKHIWSNRELLAPFQQAVEKLAMDAAEKETLLGAVSYFLLGDRSRYTIPDWLDFTSFAQRANAFEVVAEQLLDELATQILAKIDGSNVVFDALITNTSTGNLMPGLSYRIAVKLGKAIRRDSMMLDLGNVGCTGGIKAVNLANHLDDTIRHILVVSVEIPSTLINLQAKQEDVWRGNCTFGDGCAALWVSSDPAHGDTALAIEQIHFVQQAAEGKDLIHWKYDNYYTFSGADEKHFNREVRNYITAALADTESSWQGNQHWAIHPAGIAVLMRMARKLGLSRESMRPTVDHYQQYSNMSSAGIMHIIQTLHSQIQIDETINLITMGAGFNVIYGCLKKLR